MNNTKLKYMNPLVAPKYMGKKNNHCLNWRKIFQTTQVSVILLERTMVRNYYFIVLLVCRAPPAAVA